MRVLLLLVLCSVMGMAQVEKTAITELGLTFPIKSTALKDYIGANGVTSLPLTSGYSNGVEIGRHSVISNQATIGLLANANMFMASDSTWIDQIYQLNLFLVGRLYFGDSWRGGFFAELGSGPEISLAKFRGAPLIYQIDIGSRIGVGYNYKFAEDVTIGASVLISPSITMGNTSDGIKIAISMLW